MHRNKIKMEIIKITQFIIIVTIIKKNNIVLNLSFFFFETLIQLLSKLLCPSHFAKLSHTSLYVEQYTG
jgi:hypothetical protein